MDGNWGPGVKSRAGIGRSLDVYLAGSVEILDR